jgi:hypothetical protein
MSRDRTAIKSLWGEHLETKSHVDGILCQLYNEKSERADIIIPHDKFRPWSESKGYVNDFRPYYDYALEIPDKHIYQFLNDHPQFFTDNAQYHDS